MHAFASKTGRHDHDISGLTLKVVVASGTPSGLERTAPSTTTDAGAAGSAEGAAAGAAVAAAGAAAAGPLLAIVPAGPGEVSRAGKRSSIKPGRRHTYLSSLSRNNHVFKKTL